MHEISIAGSVLETVRVEARRRGARVTRVGLKVGEFAGVNPEALRFCLETLIQDSDLAPLALDLETAGGDELEFSYLEIEDG